MHGVVPAAGEGTRLRPLTETRPKGLVDIGGKQLLTRCFDRLLEIGVEKLVVVVGYRAQDIIEQYGRTYCDVPITYVYQREQLGLGHAVLQAAPRVDGEFVLLNGDNVFGTDLSSVYSQHQASEAVVTALVEQVPKENARETGVFEFTDGQVSGMIEKPADPPSTLVSAGCYVCSTELFDALDLVRLSERGEYELSDAIDVLLTAGASVDVMEFDGWRVNVNSPEDIRIVSELIQGE